ncbi:hypothetical protein [Thiohalobacter thiocyanaticus]|uniref:hypothetical protein n=1 Tax=Thiohalobacter thiocyanaticus TaxID=585455 RepID=UPI001319DD7B|nr:hypothetical protein [Thiohalobacter thiocyanaticus]
MRSPSPAQVRQALKNTAQQPRNKASEVERARRNEQQQPTPTYLRALERLYRGPA